jgi:fucokinase
MERTLRGHAETGRALAHLAQGTAMLHLSVETPSRVPGWDVIVLTAASERQARLYEMQVEAARRRGLIGPSTRTLVVPDPQGRRIGSGGATLNALRRMAKAVGEGKASSLRVLLIHAGGDSRRVPWANIPGKSFIPFPLLTDVDRPVNTVFDHQLAMAAPVAAAMRGGGLLSFAGDALPLFDAIDMELPLDGGLVVTSPVSLDVAGKHGVIVAGPDGRVADLLQKATPAELVERGALVRGCAALLDTGIYAYCGSAFEALVAVACGSPDPIAELLASGQECSLYEEIASALVPARHAWLEGRPLGPRLLAGLGRGLPLVNHVAEDLQFIHFGTTSEVLQHLAASWNGELSRRVLAEYGGGVDATAAVYASRLGLETVVGRGSLIHGCRLGDGVRVGSRCVVLAADLPDGNLRVPDNTCLWQAPLSTSAGAVATVCCGVDDNPKDALGRSTFLNRDLGAWMAAHGVGKADLWPEGGETTLWRAKVIPAAGNEDLGLTAWVMGDGGDGAAREAWCQAPRLSLADLHGAADPAAFMHREQEIVEDLVLRAVRRTLLGGGERNVDALASQVISDPARADLARLGAAIPEPGDAWASGSAPWSRTLRLKADLARSAGRPAEADALQQRSFDAVYREVAAAVKSPGTQSVCGVAAGTCVRVDLPVRFDIAGGWSDTPPYCLERPAKVLNLAMALNGQRPVGASVEALPEPRWELEIEDDGTRMTLRDGEPVLDPSGLRDRFALLRSALVLCGYGAGSQVTQGVRVRTWSRVPRGSGLGTSSILAAALVSALEQLAGRSSAPERIIDLVLILEQRLTTGGGWQDQVGGLVPGIKLVSSLPTLPLRIGIEPVPLLASVAEELQARMVLAFTGIDRLAKNVLQIVVGRYLRRDGRTLGAIADLVALAEEGKRVLALGDLDGLGAVMTRAWQIHQVLDAHCSSAPVDALFDQVADLAVGAKLAGAGGGGFLGVLAKDAEAAVRVRDRLSAASPALRIYDWSLWTGPYSV